MATALVTISFEADSKKDAEEKIKAWTLHEGCRVNISVTEQMAAVSGTIDAEGKLEEDILMVPESLEEPKSKKNG